MGAKKRQVTQICILSLILFLFLAAGIYGFYKIEYLKKSVVRDKVGSNNLSYLYDFYISGKPNIEETHYYGSPKADIFVIAYLDPTSESSRYFMSSVFPKLDNESIKSGKIKFYSKNYLTQEDFDAKNSLFTLSASLICIKSINRQKYYPFYFDIFEANPDVKSLLQKHKIPLKEFNNCMQAGNFADLTETVSEVESFGMIGMAPRFYVGIEGSNDIVVIEGAREYDKFKKAIREYGFIKGD